jgi:fumarate hydratase subunit alpha
VRYVKFEKVVEAVESLCIAAAYELPDDVLAALKKAAKKESNPSAAKILNQLIENARIAAREKIPLCQDTGLAVVFVEQGADVAIRAASSPSSLVSRQSSMDLQAPLISAVNAGVASGYQRGYLRKSVVGDPLNNRKNTGSNTPVIIHCMVVPGDKIKITVMLKGAGCENKSRFRMFNPTAGKSEIIDWVVDVVKEAGADACPPFVVGVGIGGDFEVSCLLSKKALLRNLGQRNADKFYEKLERDLLSRINSLVLGPQGLGGDTTALAVLVEAAPCHIASLPVAVNIECHSHRHKTAII